MQEVLQDAVQILGIIEMKLFVKFVPKASFQDSSWAGFITRQFFTEIGVGHVILHSDPNRDIC